MKKIISIFMLLIIIISGVYYLDSQRYTVEDIVSVDIINTNETIENDNTLLEYLPLLTKKNGKTEHNYDFSNSYDLIFNMNNEKPLYVNLIHDFENKQVHFMINEAEVFSLSKEDSLFFFKNKSFKTIYKHFEPNFTLSDESSTLEPFNDEFFIEYSFEDQDVLTYLWNNKSQAIVNVLTNPDVLTLKTTNSTTELLIYENNALVHHQRDFSEGLFVPEYDGLFEYRFQVKSNHQKEAKITKTMSYQIKVDRKPVFQLSQEEITQGGFFKIIGKYVTLDEIQSIETLIIKDIKFFKNDHEVIAYIPIHAQTKPATYDITIKTEDKYNHLYSVEVTDREFKIQNLYINASTIASTSSPAAYEEYNKYFRPVRKISSEKKYYDDAFIMPLESRISTEFGENRYVNDRVTSYSHSGLDIAAPTGTPVHAINHGLVTLSRHFALTGNTIVIDHGQGLFSYYFHLDTLNVNLNDPVKTGDLIATVGATGRSTGPHLHFGTSFYTTNIEPGYLIYGEPITKENYETLFQ